MNLKKYFTPFTQSVVCQIFQGNKGAMYGRFIVPKALFGLFAIYYTYYWFKYNPNVS